MDITRQDDVEFVMSRIFWCGFYGSGLIGSLVVYGLLQERIMTIQYDGQLFAYSVFLVLCNRIAAVIFALVLAIYERETLLHQAPLWKYAVISLSNVFASTCQYESLKYVTFAVQMLGKSFKMMPVMVWGMLISRKSYSLSDWCIALAVTGGVAEFLLTGPVASDSGHVGDHNGVRGLALMFLFLALDGLTSTMQEKLFREQRTTKYNQMMYVNGLSAIVSLVTLVFSRTLSPAAAFLGKGSFFKDTMVLSVSAVIGQFFIYSQVKEFGALVFAATMNVRQLVSICVSYATYGHYITSPQIVGLVIVFVALFYKSFTTSFQGREKLSEHRSLVQDDRLRP